MLHTINFGAGDVPWLQTESSNSEALKIHLSPANGFPIGSYTSFIKEFNGAFSFTAMDCRGAWAERSTPPRNFNMHDFADDLIRGIESQYQHPVIGMGHSQGGFVTMLAALKRPELFSKLVLIEAASLPNRWTDLVYRRVPKSLILKMVPFIRGCHERQRVWESREVFFQRYENHPTFKNFTEDALRDYTRYGLQETPDGQFELTFDPSWESHIFTKIEFMWKYLPKIRKPTLLIRAEHSNLYSHKQFTRSNRHLASHIQTMEVADTYHLIPHEAPHLICPKITHWLET